MRLSMGRIWEPGHILVYICDTETLAVEQELARERRTSCRPAFGLRNFAAPGALWIISDL